VHDDIVLGHFDTEDYSGAYLSHAYISRLAEIRRAVDIRLGAVLPFTEFPDALRNLFGVVDRLVALHSSQTQIEGAEAIAKAKREMEIIRRELGLPPEE
jgi:hypothetical protein